MHSKYLFNNPIIFFHHHRFLHAVSSASRNETLVDTHLLGCDLHNIEEGLHIGCDVEFVVSPKECVTGLSDNSEQVITHCTGVKGTARGIPQHLKALCSTAVLQQSIWQSKTKHTLSFRKHLFLTNLNIIIILIIKKRLVMQGWERVINTQSVQRPQPHKFTIPTNS